MLSFEKKSLMGKRLPTRQPTLRLELKQKIFPSTRLHICSASSWNDILSCKNLGVISIASTLPLLPKKMTVQ